MYSRQGKRDWVAHAGFAERIEGNEPMDYYKEDSGTCCAEPEHVQEARAQTGQRARRILVVEDNLALCGVVRFNLERAGFEVTQARNGREGWALLEHGEFDAVVTDFQMPEMDGGELCRLMRDHGRHQQTPVVLLTAKQLEIDLPKLQREFGVVEVFAKPFSPYELTRCLVKHVMPDQGSEW